MIIKRLSTRTGAAVETGYRIPDPRNRSRLNTGYLDIIIPELRMADRVIIFCLYFIPGEQTDDKAQ